MKNYDVVITETLQRTVQIEANDRDEAEQIAKEKWRKSEYVLDENDFKSVEYRAYEYARNREKER